MDNLELKVDRIDIGIVKLEGKTDAMKIGLQSLKTKFRDVERGSQYRLICLYYCAVHVLDMRKRIMSELHVLINLLSFLRYESISNAVKWCITE